MNAWYFIYTYRRSYQIESSQFTSLNDTPSSGGINNNLRLLFYIPVTIEEAWFCHNRGSRYTTWKSSYPNYNKQSWNAS